MRVVTLLRKPLEGSATQNVLTHGCGALNIDECRISSDGSHKDKRTNVSKISTDSGDLRHGRALGMYGAGASFVPTNHDGGRFPANLILQHKSGCQIQGNRTVKADGHYPASRPRGSQVSGPSGHSGQTGLVESHLTTETVANWICEPGCPVADLDQQSGVLVSGTGAVKRTSSANQQGNRGAAYGSESRPEGTPMISHGDKGGASRFFKQVKP
jgi:hypothetical protein